MRKGMAIVGALILFFSLLVLVDGVVKFQALSSCSEKLIQCQGSNAEYELLVSAARAEIVYGIVFGTISAIILVAGLLGNRDSAHRMQSRSSI